MGTTCTIMRRLTSTTTLLELARTVAYVLTPLIAAVFFLQLSHQQLSDLQSEALIPLTIVFIALCIHSLPSLPFCGVSAIMRGVLGLSLLPLLAAASPLREQSIHKDAAPVISSLNAQEIPDNYIVVFKKHVTHNLAVEHHGWVQKTHQRSQQVMTDLKKKRSFADSYAGLKHTYNIAGSVLGYSGHFDEDVIEQVRRHPDVSNDPTRS